MRIAPKAFITLFRIAGFCLVAVAMFFSREAMNEAEASVPRVPRVSIACTNNAECVTSCNSGCPGSAVREGWEGGNWICDPSYAPTCADVGGGRRGCSFRCAQAAAQAPVSATSTTSTAAGGGMQAGTSSRLPNPLGVSTIQGVISKIIRAGIGLAGSFALAVFVWGGILWMTARGDTNQVKKARSVLTQALIGLLLIFFSYSIISAFLQAFTSTARLGSNEPQQTPR